MKHNECEEILLTLTTLSLSSFPLHTHTYNHEVLVAFSD